MLFRTKLIKIAEDELYEAERKLLEAQTGLEWATSQVAYRTAQVERLRAYVAAKHERERLASTDPQPTSYEHKDCSGSRTDIVISGNSRA